MFSSISPVRPYHAVVSFSVRSVAAAQPAPCPVRRPRARARARAGRPAPEDDVRDAQGAPVWPSSVGVPEYNVGCYNQGNNALSGSSSGPNRSPSTPPMLRIDCRSTMSRMSLACV